MSARCPAKGCYALLFGGVCYQCAVREVIRSEELSSRTGPTPAVLGTGEDTAGSKESSDTTRDASEGVPTTGSRETSAIRQPAFAGVGQSSVSGDTPFGSYHAPRSRSPAQNPAVPKTGAAITTTTEQHVPTGKGTRLGPAAWNDFYEHTHPLEQAEDARMLHELEELRQEELRTGVRPTPAYTFNETYKPVQLGEEAGQPSTVTVKRSVIPAATASQNATTGGNQSAIDGRQAAQTSSVPVQETIRRRPRQVLAPSVLGLVLTTPASPAIVRVPDNSEHNEVSRYRDTLSQSLQAIQPPAPPPTAPRFLGTSFLGMGHQKSLARPLLYRPHLQRTEFPRSVSKGFVLLKDGKIISSEIEHDGRKPGQLAGVDGEAAVSPVPATETKTAPETISEQTELDRVNIQRPVTPEVADTVKANSRPPVTPGVVDNADADDTACPETPPSPPVISWYNESRINFENAMAALRAAEAQKKQKAKQADEAKAIKQAEEAEATKQAEEAEARQAAWESWHSDDEDTFVGRPPPQPTASVQAHSDVRRGGQTQQNPLQLRDVHNVDTIYVIDIILQGQTPLSADARAFLEKKKKEKLTPPDSVNDSLDWCLME